jgi:putative membrane protein
VRLWCSALNKPWSWHWLAYPGVWLMTALPVVAYLVAIRRHRGRTDHRTLAAFVGAMGVFWISSDWPIGTLGAGYLASVHMTEYVLYTLAVAPLLLRGIPEWMARGILKRLHLTGSARWLGRHLFVSGLIFNLVLVASHSPIAVDTLRTSQLGSFAMDMAWLASGIVLWMPILNPIAADRVESFGAKMVYLFLSAGIVPIVPASFLTFASYPLYATYELAPRVGSLTALQDQQLAGIMMKLGMVPIIWGTLAVMFFRWDAGERASESRG